jgi:IS66 C-terminal element
MKVVVLDHSDRPTLQEGPIPRDCIESQKQPVRGPRRGRGHWECLASLIETAKLHGIDPQAYLADVLAKLVNGWPVQKLDDLLPWVWAEQNRVSLAA